MSMPHMAKGIGVRMEDGKVGLFLGTLLNSWHLRHFFTKSVASAWMVGQ